MAGWRVSTTRWLLVLALGAGLVAMHSLVGVGAPSPREYFPAEYFGHELHGGVSPGTDHRAALAMTSGRSGHGDALGAGDAPGDGSMLGHGDALGAGDAFGAGHGNGAGHGDGDALGAEIGSGHGNAHGAGYAFGFGHGNGAGHGDGGSVLAHLCLAVLGALVMALCGLLLLAVLRRRRERVRRAGGVATVRARPRAPPDGPLTLAELCILRR